MAKRRDKTACATVPLLLLSAFRMQSSRILFFTLFFSYSSHLTPALTSPLPNMLGDRFFSTCLLNPWLTAYSLGQLMKTLKNSKITCWIHRNMPEKDGVHSFWDVPQIALLLWNLSWVPPPLSLRAESFLPAFVISCHFIYPSAQHLSQILWLEVYFSSLFDCEILYGKHHAIYPRIPWAYNSIWHIVDTRQGFVLGMNHALQLAAVPILAPWGAASCGSYCLVSADIGVVLLTLKKYIR